MGGFCGLGLSSSDHCFLQPSTHVRVAPSLYVSENESLTTLAVESARKALEMANVKPEEVDLVILCTSTPEDLFGGACQVVLGFQTSGLYVMLLKYKLGC